MYQPGAALVQWNVCIYARKSGVVEYIIITHIRHPRSVFSVANQRMLC